MGSSFFSYRAVKYCWGEVLLRPGPGSKEALLLLSSSSRGRLSSILPLPFSPCSLRVTECCSSSQRVLGSEVERALSRPIALVW